MKKLISFIAFILLLSTCNESNPRIGVVEEKDLTQTQIDSILDEYNFVYDDLTFIEFNNLLMEYVKKSSYPNIND